MVGPGSDPGAPVLHQALINLGEVPAGYVFSPLPVRFSAETVGAYNRVLEGTLLLGPDGRELVPPAGATALALGALLGRVVLPPGTLHIDQEVELHSPLAVGSAATCRAALTGRAVRGSTAFLTLEFSLESPDGSVVLNGRAVLMAPSASSG